MGMLTDAKIKAWQDETGIKPATGQTYQLLHEMSGEAFSLIRIIERELSGICGGDGHWYGSDPLGSTARRIGELLNRLDQVERDALDAAEAAERPNGLPPFPGTPEYVEYQRACEMTRRAFEYGRVTLTMLDDHGEEVAWDPTAPLPPFPGR